MGSKQVDGPWERVRSVTTTTTATSAMATHGDVAVGSIGERRSDGEHGDGCERRGLGKCLRLLGASVRPVSVKWGGSKRGRVLRECSPTWRTAMPRCVIQGRDKAAETEEEELGRRISIRRRSGLASGPWTSPGNTDLADRHGRRHGDDPERTHLRDEMSGSRRLGARPEPRRTKGLVHGC